MQRTTFHPSLGQRFIWRQPGESDDIVFVRSIAPPVTVHDIAQIELASESKPLRFKKSVVAMAWEVVTRCLTPVEVDLMPASKVISVANLIERMSRLQLGHFKQRVAYVIAVSSADCGLSHKSADFAKVVQATHIARLTSATRDCALRGEPIPEIELTPPSIHSVDRWFRRYRLAANDLRVLAQEVLVQAHRQPRKPDEMRVLRAFLTARRASVGRTSTAQLARDFNEFYLTVDPRHIDTVIDSLYEQARKTAEANKVLRTSKKGLTKRKRGRSVS